MPKTIVSKLPLVPMIFGSSTCNWSSVSLTTAAPRNAPHTCDTPPSTAMKRYSMPLPSENGVGFTVRWKKANSHPETAARIAASTNATSL